jgi:segregation and condensation protein A
VNPYLVQTESFQGPLDALLSMIEGRKLHVSEISLASVTEDFARYVTDNTLDIGDRTRSLSILATLLLIKARTLVPRLALAEEEEQSIEDLKSALERLAAVRAGQRALEKHSAKFEAFLGAEQPKGVVFAPGTDVTAVALYKAVAEMLSVRTKETEKVPLPETRIRPTLTITDALERVREALSNVGGFSLQDSVDRVRTATDPADRYHAKVETVVLFLALLEFVRQGIADVIDTGTEGIVPQVRSSGTNRDSVAQ